MIDGPVERDFWCWSWEELCSHGKLQYHGCNSNMRRFLFPSMAIYAYSLVSENKKGNSFTVNTWSWGRYTVTQSLRTKHWYFILIGLEKSSKDSTRFHELTLDLDLMWKNKVLYQVAHQLGQGKFPVLTVAFSTFITSMRNMNTLPQFRNSKEWWANRMGVGVLRYMPTISTFGSGLSGQRSCNGIWQCSYQPS